MRYLQSSIYDDLNTVFGPHLFWRKLLSVNLVVYKSKTHTGTKERLEMASKKASPEPQKELDAFYKPYLSDESDTDESVDSVDSGSSGSSGGSGSSQGSGSSEGSQSSGSSVQSVSTTSEPSVSRQNIFA
jgi:uncharacterized membrane protein YgcG